MEFRLKLIRRFSAITVSPEEVPARGSSGVDRGLAPELRDPEKFCCLTAITGIGETGTADFVPDG